jgi:hypothetical protein
MRATSARKSLISGLRPRAAFPVPESAQMMLLAYQPWQAGSESRLIRNSCLFTFLEINQEPLLAIVQNLFCDEGGKYHTGDVVSFVGLVVSPARLQTFNDAWQALLQSYELHSFHMRQLADVYSAHGPKLPRDRTIPQTITALIPFADCINANLEIGLIQAWDVKGYISMPTAAKERLGGSLDDPHYMAFVRGIVEVNSRLLENNTVNVICDDDLMKAWDMYLHYRAICQAMPEIKKRVAALTFARDDDFPALQAADMLAFLSRLEAEARFGREPNQWKGLFDHLIKEPKPGRGLMRWFSMFADETALLTLAASLTKPLGTP